MKPTTLPRLVGVVLGTGLLAASLARVPHSNSLMGNGGLLFVLAYVVAALSVLASFAAITARELRGLAQVTTVPAAQLVAAQVVLGIGFLPPVAIALFVLGLGCLAIVPALVVVPHRG